VVVHGGPPLPTPLPQIGVSHIGVQPYGRMWLQDVVLSNIAAMMGGW
jgi:hypothetical protein